MMFIEFTVLGIPAPKGSSRAMLLGGNAVNVPSGSNVNRTAMSSWDNAVRVAAAEAVRRSWRANHGAPAPATMGLIAEGGAGVFFPDIALRIKIEFRMPRLKSHFNKKTGQVRTDAPKWHKVKPDISKLLRATEDSLKGIVMLDDALFAETLKRKVYADPGREGAWIRIEALEEP